jgi:hypothetical protein
MKIPVLDCHRAPKLRQKRLPHRRGLKQPKKVLNGFRRDASLGIEGVGTNQAERENCTFWRDRVHVRSLHLQLGCDFGGTNPPKTVSKGLLTLKLSECK